MCQVLYSNVKALENLGGYCAFLFFFFFFFFSGAREQGPPLQALLAVKGPAGPAVGKGQEGDEEGEAEVARG